MTASHHSIGQDIDAYIVAQFHGADLLDSEIDVRGKAYEEIVGSNLRGNRGEFFNPHGRVRQRARFPTSRVFCQPTAGSSLS